MRPFKDVFRGSLPDLMALKSRFSCTVDKTEKIFHRYDLARKKSTKVRLRKFANPAKTSTGAHACVVRSFHVQALDLQFLQQKLKDLAGPTPGYWCP
jgi:hypothetical protein